MSRMRRQPVVYRFQIWTWSALVVISVALVLLFVPTTVQEVIAFVVLGLAAVAAALVWRVSEYRVCRLGPVTSTGSNAWVLGSVAVNFAVMRMVGGGGSFLASVAGLGVGIALTLPLFTYATALRDPPPDPTRTASDRSAAGDA